MTEAVNNQISKLAGRYNLNESAEWQKLLRHFDLAADGFAFIVLLVPDIDGEEICRQALELNLAESGKTLWRIPLEKPDELKSLANKLLDLELPQNTGAVWVAATTHHTLNEEEHWKAAWREGVAQLNQYRNPLRNRIQVTLIFAGTSWLQEVLREMAPDLWSVRTLIVNVVQSNERNILSKGVSNVIITGDSNIVNVLSDPEFALKEARKLRGQASKELALAKLLHRAGEGLMDQPGKTQEAISVLKEALSLFQLHNLKAEESAVLHLLGTIHLRLGEFGAANSLFESALSISRQLGDHLGEMGALGNLGIAYNQLGGGGIRKAIEYHEKHLSMAREIGDQPNECIALSNLGDDYIKLGETHKAIELYERSLAIARKIQFRLGEIVALGALGHAYAVSGALRKAIDFTEQSLAISRELGDRMGEAIGLWNLALTWESLGERKLAIENAKAALKIREQIEDPRTDRIRKQIAEWEDKVEEEW